MYLPLRKKFIIFTAGIVLFSFAFQAFKVHILIGVILMLPLAITLASYFSKKFIEPINQVQNIVDLWQKGDLKAQIAALNQKELAKLANTLNGLIAKFTQNEARLQAIITQQNQQKAQYQQGIQRLLQKHTDLLATNQKLAKMKTEVDLLLKKSNLILAGVGEGIIAVNLNREIIYFNPAAETITGYKSTEVLKKAIDATLSFFGQEDTKLAAQNYCPLSNKTGEDIVFYQKRLKVTGKNEKTASVNLLAKSLSSSGEVDLGAIMTLHDVTKEEDLEKMKLDFVSMAAHELRTPLTTIQGYLSFMQQEDTLKKIPEEEQVYVKKAFASAIRLNEMIENLLEVSRLEQGRMTIKAQKTALTPMVARICEEITVQAKNKGLSLEFKPPKTKLPEVMIDAIRIEEVLNNLIGNAIKYTEKGGIKVFIEQQKNFLIVSVSDTGRGIPEKALSQMFTKFFRVESNITAGVKGSGIGLFVSKNIVEAHGGKIWVESVEGRGSVFSFSVPLA